MINGRNPNDTRPLDIEDMDNEYIPKEGETRPQKMARYNRVKKILKEDIDNQVGIKDFKLISAFRGGIVNGEE